MTTQSETLTPFERHLCDENRALREEVRAIHAREMPDGGGPEHELWRAIMEDARDRGDVRIEVRYVHEIQIEWMSA